MTDQQKPRSDFRVYSMREILDLAGDEAARPRKKVLTSTHFALDAATGGFEPGFVWTMGAETNFGKTSWLVAVADTNINHGKRALIVSGEDSETLYGRRFMLRRARISVNDLRHKKLTVADHAKIAEVRAKGEPLPVIVCTNGRPIEKLMPELERIVKGEGIDLLALDYLQAITTERRTKAAQDRRHEVAHVARLVTDMVKTNGISGLLLSQITYDKQRRGPPGKYDLRESQDLANAAEVVVMGYRPEDTEYADHGKDVRGQPMKEPIFRAGERYLLLVKNKAGETGVKFQLKWDQYSACFDDVVDPEQERLDRLHEELCPADWDQ